MKDSNYNKTHTLSMFKQKNQTVFVEFEIIEITVEEEIVPLAIFKGHNGRVHENGSMPLHLRSLSISSDQKRLVKLKKHQRNRIGNI